MFLNSLVLFYIFCACELYGICALGVVGEGP